MPDISIATRLTAVKVFFEADKKAPRKDERLRSFQESHEQVSRRRRRHVRPDENLRHDGPVSLQGIYVRVNILEKLTRLTRLTPEELEEALGKDRRGFGTLRTKKPKLGLAVVKEIPKLFVLGKLGAGKTTFLKYRKNRYVMSCRIAAYDHIFEAFADVEMADFRPENKPIKELTGTPLLLTMLRLKFDEVKDFPTNPAELYKEALVALLKKSDSSRNIEREEVYKKLSLQHKEALLRIDKLCSLHLWT